ncbi:Hypothetical predicted protein [Podarcis lilfordi]|uniref:Uncharacterized protein n=1 Tax=Podarcis lilfordi TaxID=74358 RepID=A0AA35PRA6_9SAUR|nr:Hypothetical predicted protein [Podarcis lilfordi]
MLFFRSIQQICLVERPSATVNALPPPSPFSHHRSLYAFRAQLSTVLTSLSASINATLVLPLCAARELPPSPLVQPSAPAFVLRCRYPEVTAALAEDSKDPQLRHRMNIRRRLWKKNQKIAFITGMFRISEFIGISSHVSNPTPIQNRPADNICSF